MFLKSLSYFAFPPLRGSLTLTSAFPSSITEDSPSWPSFSYLGSCCVSFSSITKTAHLLLLPSLTWWLLPAPPACLRLAAQRAPLLLRGTVLCLSAALLHPPSAYGDSLRSDLESLLSLSLLRQAHPLAEEISCQLDTRPLECSSRRLLLSVPWALPFTK